MKISQRIIMMTLLGATILIVSPVHASTRKDRAGEEGTGIARQLKKQMISKKSGLPAIQEKYIAEFTKLSDAIEQKNTLATINAAMIKAQQAVAKMDQQYAQLPDGTSFNDALNTTYSDQITSEIDPATKLNDFSATLQISQGIINSSNIKKDLTAENTKVTTVVTDYKKYKTDVLDKLIADTTIQATTASSYTALQNQAEAILLLAQQKINDIMKNDAQLVADINAILTDKFTPTSPNVIKNSTEFLTQQLLVQAKLDLIQKKKTKTDTTNNIVAPKYKDILTKIFADYTKKWTDYIPLAVDAKNDALTKNLPEEIQTASAPIGKLYWDIQFTVAKTAGHEGVYDESFINLLTQLTSSNDPLAVAYNKAAKDADKASRDNYDLVTQHLTTKFNASMTRLKNSPADIALITGIITSFQKVTDKRFIEIMDPLFDKGADEIVKAYLTKLTLVSDAYSKAPKKTKLEASALYNTCMTFVTELEKALNTYTKTTEIKGIKKLKDLLPAWKTQLANDLTEINKLA